MTAQLQRTSHIYKHTDTARIFIPAHTYQSPIILLVIQGAQEASLILKLKDEEFLRGYHG